jgi:hypothetical protein
VWAAAQVVELFAWLAWLRASENFGIDEEDVSMCLPSDSEWLGLPPDTGCILLRLLESTKSDQTKQADMIMAFLT